MARIVGAMSQPPAAVGLSVPQTPLSPACRPVRPSFGSSCTRTAGSPGPALIAHRLITSSRSGRPNAPSWAPPHAAAQARPPSLPWTASRVSGGSEQELRKEANRLDLTHWCKSQLPISVPPRRRRACGFCQGRLEGRPTKPGLSKAHNKPSVRRSRSRTLKRGGGHGK